MGERRPVTTRHRYAIQTALDYLTPCSSSDLVEVAVGGGNPRRKRGLDISRPRKKLKYDFSDSSEESPEAQGKEENTRLFEGWPRDLYCWSCHMRTEEYDCPNCVRTYHQVCFNKLRRKDCDCKFTYVELEQPNMKEMDDIPFLCGKVVKAVEDERIKKGECDLDCLKYLIKGAEERKVCENVDILHVRDKIEFRWYKNTNELLLDFKWMTHNCQIVYGSKDWRTKMVTKIEKEIKQHIVDLESCWDCYISKFEKHPVSKYFVYTCSPPHPIVWAKLKGYPFWPAKCLRIVNGCADVRFFGTYDKSIIPLAQVYKISKENPAGKPKSRSYEVAVSEMLKYVENYEQQYGTFQFYDKKTPLQLKKSYGKKGCQNRKKIESDSMDGHGNDTEVDIFRSVNNAVIENDNRHTEFQEENPSEGPICLNHDSGTFNDIENRPLVDVDHENQCKSLGDSETNAGILPPSTGAGRGSRVSRCMESNEDEIEIIFTSEKVKQSNVHLPPQKLAVPIQNSNDNVRDCQSTSKNNSGSAKKKARGSTNRNNISGIPSTSSSIGETQRIANLDIGADGEIIDDDITILKEIISPAFTEKDFFRPNGIMASLAEDVLYSNPKLRKIIEDFKRTVKIYYAKVWLQSNSLTLTQSRCNIIHAIQTEFKSKIKEVIAECAQFKTKIAELEEKIKEAEMTKKSMAIGSKGIMEKIQKRVAEKCKVIPNMDRKNDELREKNCKKIYHIRALESQLKAAKSKNELLLEEVRKSSKQ